MNIRGLARKVGEAGLDPTWGIAGSGDCVRPPTQTIPKSERVKRGAADYWQRSSARQFLPGITTPTLILNARNDPFLTADSMPGPEAAANPSLFLETPDSGGHVGFLDFARGVQPWSERRVAEFLAG